MNHSDSTDHPAIASSGVESLIERLRDQGVEKGREEARKIVEEAQKRAGWLLSQAEEETRQLREKAHREAEQLRTAGNEALKIAARDMNLEIKETMTRSFSDQVRRLVALQMDNAEFMRRLILELVGRVRENASLDEAGQLELLLAEGVIGLDELRRNPDEYKEGQLSHFVQSLAGEILQEGVTFGAGRSKGIRVKLTEKNTEIDLSDAAVSELLLRHLQPRFRAFLEGVIK
jgi:V/A-type H+-transporting ATPase subunit E